MMRSFVRTILASTATVAAVALMAGAASPAPAQDGGSHTLLVQLPNGQMAQIDDPGPLAPRLLVAAPDDDALAAFRQMAAMMDQQAAAMLRQAAQMPGDFGAMPNLPTGVSGYSVVTTVSNGHACTRSTEIRYDGHSLQPQTVSSVSGDCGALPGQGTTPAELPAPSQPPAAMPRTLRVKYTRPAPNHGLVHEAFYQRAPGQAD